jgi:multidrug resistance efflux pump
MAQLERHPDGLTMGELSRRMMVTGGNVTGIADQLESEGLVQRVTVRIALDPQQIQGLPLVPGLSASVRVRRR